RARTLPVLPLWMSLSVFVLCGLPGRTLFPYTTLFRSPEGHQPDVSTRIFQGVQHPICIVLAHRSTNADSTTPAKVRYRSLPSGRSEEHTSELQSRENLVCRLLLEKKNTAASTNTGDAR